MTTNKELFYWAKNPNWYNMDEDSDNVTLTNEAPERAKKSFEMWKKRKEFYSDENNL
jgi:hypothetical protein